MTKRYPADFASEVLNIRERIADPQPDGTLWAHFLRLLAEGLENGWIVPSQALLLIADVGHRQVSDH